MIRTSKMASRNDERTRIPDEETPLLQVKSKTPLPWAQMSLAFIALFAEPISSAYILPFINQLIGELGITGGDDRKIGYYAGLIESLFFATQAITGWQWSRLSDFIGRRPVILVGLLGLSASSIAFGLSRTLPTLILSRCIAGILNGNVGVMKSMLGDISDHTNMAQVFTLVPTVFCTGFVIAPLYGGALVKPQERWPNVFRGDFWATYPYFLPSLVAGCFTLMTFVICATFMKESLPSRMARRTPSEMATIENPQNQVDIKPFPMTRLLRTYSVMIPILNYGMLALVEIGFLVLLPLFYSSPVEIGGLGLPPSIIGVILAALGLASGLMQGLLSSRIIAWIGAKKVFCGAVLWYYPAFLLFPIMSTIVTAQGKVGPIIWAFIVVQLLCMVLMGPSFIVVFIFITRAAPNKQSLGSTNGLGQSPTSVARAIGPVLATSLFAVSKEYNILGGNFVYIILILLTTLLVFLSRRLPDLRDSE